MKRRSFLTLLGSGLIGVSLVDVQWVPGVMGSTLPPAVTGPVMSIEAAVAEVLRQMVTFLPDLRATFVPGDYAIFQPGLPNQFHVGLSLPHTFLTEGIDAERDLFPAAAALADHVRALRPTHFGALAIPGACDHGAVATDERTGVTVRGLTFFDILGQPHEDEQGEVEYDGPGWLTRFDILARAA